MSWKDQTQARPPRAEVHLFSNSATLIKAVRDVLPGVTVRTWPIGAGGARGSTVGMPTSSRLSHVKLGLGGTPLKADAVVTKSADSGLLNRFAMGKGTPYVVILPDQAEWFLDRVMAGRMVVLIGSDAARTWA